MLIFLWSCNVFAIPSIVFHEIIVDFICLRILFRRYWCSIFWYWNMFSCNICNSSYALTYPSYTKDFISPNKRRKCSLVRTPPVFDKLSSFRYNLFWIFGLIIFVHTLPSIYGNNWRSYCDYRFIQMLPQLFLNTVLNSACQMPLLLREGHHKF